MTSITKTLAKGSFATLAAGAMVVAAASPATAQDRRGDRHDRGGPSAGEVIAGAVVIGGIAAILSSRGNNRDRDYRYNDRNYRDRDDRRYNNRRGRNNNRGNESRAVERCIRAAERQAERYSGGRAEVTEIRDVDRERRGFEVKGRIAVQSRHDNRGYGRNRGYRNNSWDEGRFTCDFRRGRVTNVNFRGIRGL